MNTEITCAEVVDRFLNRVVMVAFLTGLIAAAAAAEYLVDEQVALYLVQGKLVLRVLLFAVMSLIAINSLPKLLRNKKTALYEPEGFITEVFKKSATSSWAITVVFIALTATISEHYAAQLPPKFFLEVILAVMFGAFSATFLIVNHSDSDGIEEDGVQ